MKPGRSAAVEKRARKTDLFNEGTAQNAEKPTHRGASLILTIWAIWASWLTDHRRALSWEKQPDAPP
jgi:hypothetical protein